MSEKTLKLILKKASLVHRYTNSVYWAATTVSTVGYGDILPLSNTERTFALSIMLLGAVVTAIMFGVIANLLTESLDNLPTSIKSQQEVRWGQCFCLQK